MKRVFFLLIAFTLMLIFTPFTIHGLPASPEVTPENGCVFADAVLQEIENEEARLYVDIERSTMPRKVVLTVQVRSGDSLRKATHKWKSENCLGF